MTIGATRCGRVQHDVLTTDDTRNAPLFPVDLGHLIEILKSETRRQAGSDPTNWSSPASSEVPPRKTVRPAPLRRRVPQPPALYRSARQARSAVLSLVAATSTVLALAAGLGAIALIPNSFADGPTALRKSIGEWHARGADRLMETMLSRQRRLVPDAAEESAAHEPLPVDAPATSPIVPPNVAVSPPETSLPVHHRRVMVSDTGLASIDLSALSPTADAAEGVVLEGLPGGLVPMIGRPLDGNRWKVDAGDLGAFGLVLGVNPPEKFELRIARYSSARVHRADASIVVDLVVPPPPPVLVAPPPPPPAPRIATRTPPVASEKVASEKPVARRKAAEQPAPVPPPAVRIAAPAPRKAAAPANGVTIAAPRPRPMGVGVRPSRAEKPDSAAAPAAETPWWTKPAPFKIEDSAVQR